MHLVSLCAQNIILSKFKVKKILEGKYSVAQIRARCEEGIRGHPVVAQTTERSGGKERIGKGYRWTL
jgi:hypothetical protein